VQIVQSLLGRLLAPLGGLDGERTRSFVNELALLLDTPINPED
jgi:hypothetical protein